MAGIAGMLNTFDLTETVDNIGQVRVFEQVTKYLAEHRASLDAQTKLFIKEKTAEDTFHYDLPGGGFLEERGTDALPTASKTYGGWDVSVPLSDYARQYAGNDVDMAYMTLKKLSDTVENVVMQDRATMRRQILRALFNNVTKTWKDPITKKTLTLRPIANGDDRLYPPLIGSDSQAEVQDNHFWVTGYAASSINNTNNPLKPILVELMEHDVARTGGTVTIVTFIHSGQQAYFEALAGFKAVPDAAIRTGVNTDVPVNLPNVPGRIIGRCNEQWISVWDYIPTGYMASIDLAQDAPLVYRHDPLNTKLGVGLQLVKKVDTEPFVGAFYRHRYGLAAIACLGVVITHIKASGSYDIPAALA